MNRIGFLLVVVMCCGLQLEGKVKILTFHYNKPDFIELHVKACKQFLQHDFEILVFNDAANLTTEIAILETCKNMASNVFATIQNGIRTTLLTTK